jgi:hypothetical protein
VREAHADETTAIGRSRGEAIMKLLIIYTDVGDPIVHDARCRNAERDADAGRGFVHGTEIVFAESLAQIAAVVFADRLAHAGVDVTEDTARPYIFSLDVKPCVPLDEIASVSP